MKPWLFPSSYSLADPSFESTHLYIAKQLNKDGSTSKSTSKSKKDKQGTQDTGVGHERTTSRVPPSHRDESDAAQEPSHASNMSKRGAEERYWHDCFLLKASVDAKVCMCCVVSPKECSIRPN